MSLVLLQVQSEWTSDCHTIDPAGPKNGGRGSRWWRRTKKALSWRGLLVCALVSSHTLTIKGILLIDKWLNCFTFIVLFIPPVKIPVDRVQEAWETSSGPFHKMRLADHYGVFKDLFPMAYFLPQVSLQVCHGQDNSGQVYYGNRLTPTEVRKRTECLTVSESCL